MRPQLQELIDEFEQARNRLLDLARVVPEEAWSRSADPGQWSVAECVGHLNLSSEVYLPLLRDALERVRSITGPQPRRYRRDPVGWFLWKTMGPPVRFRVKTSTTFIPIEDNVPGKLVQEFERLQDEQVACVREADGLPLGKIRVTSPFDKRIRYNIFSLLSILPRHQHRHLWQAEQAWKTLNGE